jgi:hypothetical protein
MQVNKTKSGVVSGVGMDKLLIAIDGADRGEVEGQEARDMARKAASEAGFGAGGMCDQPITGPLGPDGEMLDGADALTPELIGNGFRTEFLFAQRA